MAAGTEQFNKSPSAGVVFLQEQGVIQTPLDPQQLAMFLKHNPSVNKLVLGEYLGARKNSLVLEAFVRYVCVGVSMCVGVCECVIRLCNILQRFTVQWSIVS